MTFYTRDPDKKRCFDLDCEEHNEKLAKRLHERYSVSVEDRLHTIHECPDRDRWLADARELRTPR